MATIAQERVPSNLSPDDAALEMVRLVEGYFDEIGLSEAERDERYARAEEAA